MPITVTPNRTINRFDNDYPLIFSVSGVTDTGKIKVGDWSYIQFSNAASSVPYFPPNQTEKACRIEVRNVFRPTWELDAGIVLDDNDDLERTSGEGWNGAYYDTELSEVNCSIEAKVVSISDVANLTTGISLQSGAIEHNYLLSTVEHSILLGQLGQGTIREKGETVKNGYFNFTATDRVMIELSDGIVRYYLIDADNKITTLRTTRSKLTGAPKAEAMLYSTNSALTDIFVYDNEKTVTTVEMVGVLENFQDWLNDFAFSSTADVLQMADNSPRFTFASSKTRLISANLTRNLTDKETRDYFVSFFLYHGIEKNFLFIDNARDITIWARFTSALSDKARHKCAFANGIGIIEDERGDYIPILVDSVPPTVSLTTITFGSVMINGTASDAVALASLTLYANNIEVAQMLYPPTGAFTFTLEPSEVPLGYVYFHVVASDHGRNTTKSNTLSVFHDDIPPEVPSNPMETPSSTSISFDWDIPLDDDDILLLMS